MSVDSLWIFINDTDKVEGGLMVLFFSFVFSVASPFWKFFCQRPWLSGLFGVRTKRSQLCLILLVLEL